MQAIPDLKGSVSREFWPSFLFMIANLSGPLINRLKYFLIDFAEIFDHKLDSVVCSLTLRWDAHCGVWCTPWSFLKIRTSRRNRNEFENTLACLSGAYRWVRIMKTNGGRKFRDTLPLNEWDGKAYSITKKYKLNHRILSWFIGCKCILNFIAPPWAENPGLITIVNKN